MITTASFKVRFPEFAAIDDPPVQQALDETYRELDDTKFGSRLDDAAGYLAAHKLCTSPFGQQARLESDDAMTTYLKEYQRIARPIGCGPWVL